MNHPAGPPPASGRPSGRGGRPAILTPQRIITAAIDILDAEGLDALTMRRVGTHLGVSAMSLYRHVPNRDALLAALVDRLSGSLTIDLAPGCPWPEALTRFAIAFRRMLLGHPNAAPLLATHPVNPDTGLAMMSGVLDRFAAAGIAQTAALIAIQSVGVFVLGHALAQVGTPPGADHPPPSAPPEFYDQWFDTGLRAMVTGLRHQLTT